MLGEIIFRPAFSGQHLRQKSSRIGHSRNFTTAQRCRSETEKNILGGLFRSVLPQFKKYHPSRNLKFNNLRIFQSLKLRTLFGKNPSNFS